MKQRKEKKFYEKHANTERYMKSSIPYMQKLLNKEDVIFKKFSSNISPKSFYASEIRPLDSITIDNLNYNK